MSSLSTHILDVSLGRPAAGVAMILAHLSDKPGEGDYGMVTDADGRCRYSRELSPGDYRLTFLVGPYFAALNQLTLYPEVTIAFTIAADHNQSQPHYHIPLLLSPYGYTTYRGS
jgi:5-hydroxyisourate hydrolase